MTVLNTIAASGVRGHVVTMALPFWGTRPSSNPQAQTAHTHPGHNKPLCALLVRQLRVRPIHATVLTQLDYREKVVAEIDQH